MHSNRLREQQHMRTGDFMNNSTKIIIKYLKIVILSIVTFGLYGAYWIFVNMMDNPETADPDTDDESRSKRRAQDTIALTWLHFLNR